MREAIGAQPKARFDRAHFKNYGESALIFESAFYFSDSDYNRYMDAQQAINLAIYQGLQHEGITLACPPPVVVNERAREHDEPDHRPVWSRDVLDTDDVKEIDDLPGRRVRDRGRTLPSRVARRHLRCSTLR